MRQDLSGSSAAGVWFGLCPAAVAMRIKHLAIRPVVDADGYLLGVLTAGCAATLLATPSA